MSGVRLVLYVTPTAAERLALEAARRSEIAGVVITDADALRAILYQELGLGPDGRAHVLIEEEEEEDDDPEDRAYARGCASVYREILMAAVRGLGRPSVRPDATPDQLRARIGVLENERSRAVEELRRLCAEFGDNDWPDDLHLPDVIEEHLGRYLDVDEGGES